MSWISHGRAEARFTRNSNILTPRKSITRRMPIMDLTRRTILAAGAAAAATAAVPGAFAQQSGKTGTGKFYERGQVRRDGFLHWRSFHLESIEARTQSHYRSRAGAACGLASGDARPEVRRRILEDLE